MMGQQIYRASNLSDPSDPSFLKRYLKGLIGSVARPPIARCPFDHSCGDKGRRGHRSIAVVRPLPAINPTATPMTTTQFIHTDAGQFVAASEISTITADAAGGYLVTFRAASGLPPARCNDLAGLGEIRPARRGASGIWQGERRAILAHRICPVTNVAHPIWGLRDVPLKGMFAGFEVRDAKRLFPPQQ